MKEISAACEEQQQRIADQEQELQKMQNSKEIEISQVSSRFKEKLNEQVSDPGKDLGECEVFVETTKHCCRGRFA